MKTIARLVTDLLMCLVLFAANPAWPYEAEVVRDGGTISGLVKYGGPPPSMTPLAVTKDREVCGSLPVYDQSLIVGADRGVANAVVTIANMARGQSLTPMRAVRFDQKGCQYIPHVAVFPAGSTVLIVNSDGILHNVHTESVQNPVIDLAQPGFKKLISVTVERPEVIKVACDAHNWMQGWWYVTANPYYSLTDLHGHYVIHNVPPGSYTLRVWQERLGTQWQNIVVHPGSTTAADFMFHSSPQGS